MTRFGRPPSEGPAPSLELPASTEELWDRALASLPKRSAEVPPNAPHFFPRRAAPKARRVEPMLESMADGVLVGESSEGARSIRIELTDEFFGGAAVEISILRGELKAIFHPVDWPGYELLRGETARLVDLLHSKGLSVRSVEVVRPA